MRDFLSCHFEFLSSFHIKYLYIILNISNETIYFEHVFFYFSMLQLRLKILHGADLEIK